LSCVKETDDHEKADLEKELNKIEATKYAMALRLSVIRAHNINVDSYWLHK
jgi:hypothetical protein